MNAVELGIRFGPGWYTTYTTYDSGTGNLRRRAKKGEILIVNVVGLGIFFRRGWYTTYITHGTPGETEISA